VAERVTINEPRALAFLVIRLNRVSGDLSQSTPRKQRDGVFRISMPRKKRGKKNPFVDDEAEHSGAEEGDEYMDEGENEYDFHDPFIDDQPITSAPPPIFPLLNGDDVSIHTLPPSPRQPPPPPSSNDAAPPPPPPPPAKKPASDWIRPKSNRDKRMCQIVQQALMPAVHVGYLQHVLVTVIPDYKEKLEDARDALTDRTKAFADSTHQYAVDNPWKTLGIAAAGLAALGYLFMRRD